MRTHNLQNSGAEMRNGKTPRGTSAKQAEARGLSGCFLLPLCTCTELTNHTRSRATVVSFTFYHRRGGSRALDSDL